jgi:peptidoglycan/LPS O-acetylase OafA/YrhL
MNISMTKAIRLCLILLFFVTVKALIAYSVLSGFALMMVDVEFEQKTNIQVFYSATGKFSEEKMFQSSTFPAGKRKQIRVYLQNEVCRHLRIDPGNQPGRIKIYQIKLASYYGKSLTLGPEQIEEYFKPAHQISTFRPKNDYFLIKADGVDPFFLSTKPIQVSNFFLNHIFPLLSTILFWLFLNSFSLKKFWAIYDLQYKESSTGVQIRSLDGVRGIAALMVLAEHTGLVDGIGAIGVWLFFCLSGFLLATPFVNSPHKAYSPAYMQEFLLRRLKRIIPMYYTFLLVTMVFHVKNPELFRHLLFLQGDGHLWTIPQEMFFYLLLPFIMLLCCAPFPKRRLFSLVIIGVLIYCANTYMNKEMVSLYGYGTSLQPLVGVFLSGVFFAFLHSWLQEIELLGKSWARYFKKVASVVGILLLTGMVAGCSDPIREVTQINIEQHFGIVGFAAAFLILIVALSDNTMIARLVGLLPLRAVGIVGYSFYLLHPKMMGFARDTSIYFFDYRLNGIALFIVAGLLTYLMSTVTYTYIERPILRKV